MGAISNLFLSAADDTEQFYRSFYTQLTVDIAYNDRIKEGGIYLNLHKQ